MNPDSNRAARTIPHEKRPRIKFARPGNGNRLHKRGAPMGRVETPLAMRRVIAGADTGANIIHHRPSSPPFPERVIDAHAGIHQFLEHLSASGRRHAPIAATSRKKYPFRVFAPVPRARSREAAPPPHDEAPHDSRAAVPSASMARLTGTPQALKTAIPASLRSPFKLRADSRQAGRVSSRSGALRFALRPTRRRSFPSKSCGPSRRQCRL